MVSSDGGKNFRDLGIVLESGDPVNCSAENGFFGGGHGDFSVILDRERKHFYFLFGNYGGPWWNQGVAMARMAFEDRAQPQGAVFKYANGAWSEPGIGGAVTPILPPRVGWNFADTDAFWGPAIHWNTAIERYVVLLNRSCCEKGWPQEGIYVMFGSDLSNPATWTYPQKILDKSEIGAGAGFYPQVFGTGEGETDSAGRTESAAVREGRVEVGAARGACGGSGASRGDRRGSGVGGGGIARLCTRHRDTETQRPDVEKTMKTIHRTQSSFGFSAA